MSLIISWLLPRLQPPTACLNEIVWHELKNNAEKKSTRRNTICVSNEPVLFEYIVHRCLSIMFPVHVRGKTIVAISCAWNPMKETNRSKQPSCRTRKIWIHELESENMGRAQRASEETPVNSCKLQQKKQPLFVYRTYNLHCRRTRDSDSKWMRKRKLSYSGTNTQMRSEPNDWLDWSVYVLVKLFWRLYGSCETTEFIDESPVKCFMGPVSITRHIDCYNPRVSTHYSWKLRRKAIQR